MANKYYVTAHPDSDGEYRVVVVDDPAGDAAWIAMGTLDHCLERAKSLNAEAERQADAREHKRKTTRRS